MARIKYRYSTQISHLALVLFSHKFIQPLVPIINRIAPHKSRYAEGWLKHQRAMESAYRIDGVPYGPTRACKPR